MQKLKFLRLIKNQKNIAGDTLKSICFYLYTNNLVRLLHWSCHKNKKSKCFDTKSCIPKIYRVLHYA